MRERINRLLGKNSPLTMGTFHSVCVRILRQDIGKLTPPSSPPYKGGEIKGGYDRNFVIFDASDAEALIKQIIMELHLSEKFRPAVFSYYISSAKNQLVHPTALHVDNSFFAETLQEVYEEYQKRLREHNALDFDDLLGLVCELFLHHPNVLKKYQDRFPYVLVDEYQDTNHAQYIMLKALVAEHENIFVVGDDAQSIYGFRGANMQNILDFQKDYPKAHVIILEQNYRSTQGILDVAHNVIKLNPFQYEKKLWTNLKEGPKVNLYEAKDEMDEAEFVLKQITGSRLQIQDRDTEEPAYVNEDTPILNRFTKTYNFKPLILNDTVILYRTHAQSRPFEEVLLASSIPYQIVGGIKFYERKEIKDVLAFLRLVLNPRDLVSLSRIINEPARGIGRATLREVTKGLAQYDYNYLRLFRNLESLEFKDKVYKAVKDFFHLFLAVSDLPKNTTLMALMDFFLTRSGYKDKLLALGEEGETRWENIEELFNVAAKYKNRPLLEGLRDFLEEVALMTDLDSLEENENKLTLMTLHSAKGLEFERVFFVGLEEGLLPHSRSLLHPDEIAEEIRLAYVGITRAKKDLYLSYAFTRQVFGEMRRSVPSRIIKAIPKRLLRKIGYE